MRKPSPHLALPALALCLAFSACQGSPAPASTGLADDSNAPRQVQVADDTPAPQPSGILRMPFTDQGFDYRSTATSRGFYELESLLPLTSSAMDATRVMYTDFTTRRQAVLCADAGCPHTDDSCTGWLPGNAYRYMLAEAGPGMVLVDRGDEQPVGDEKTGTITGIEVEPGTVYTMDAGGGNRQLLYTTPAGSCADPFLATDDTWLYLNLRHPPEKPATDNYDAEIVHTLVRINLRTGQAEDLVVTNGMRDAPFPTAVVEGQFLYDITIYPRDPDSLGDDHAAWEANYQAGVCAWFLLHPATGEITSLAVEETAADMYGATVSGEYLYVSHNNSSALRRVHLRTGAEENLLNLEPGCEPMAGAPLDGHLPITVIDKRNFTTTGQDGVQTGEILTTYHWADPDTGQLHDWPLYTTRVYSPGAGFAEETFTEPIVPIADAGDHYLVVQQYNPEGTWVKPQQRALITKADFWAGVEGFIPITVIE